MDYYRDREETYDVEGKIVRQTEKAYLVDFTLQGELWLPKSQITGMSEAGEDGKITFTVTSWWATRAGIL